MRLYHYTCSHMAAGINRTRRLQPHASPFWGGHALCWLTDQAVPDLHGLGLQNSFGEHGCDRTEHRFFTTDAAVPWLKSRQRKALPTTLRLALEDGRQAEHWWITEHPIKVMEDLDYRKHRIAEEEC